MFKLFWDKTTFNLTTYHQKYYFLSFLWWVILLYNYSKTQKKLFCVNGKLKEREYKQGAYVLWCTDCNYVLMIKKIKSILWDYPSRRSIIYLHKPSDSFNVTFNTHYTKSINVFENIFLHDFKLLENFLKLI